MLICRDYRNQILHYLFILPWEWCHDDTETSAFNANIRLIIIISSSIIISIFVFSLVIIIKVGPRIDVGA